MKPPLRPFLLALGLLTTLPALGVTPFTDEFTEAALNSSRWTLTEEGGELMPSDGKLLYQVGKAGRENSSHILLRGIQPKYKESWVVTVDAVNSTRIKGWTWIGVAVLNAADEEDYVGLEISSGKNMTEIFSDFGTDGVDAADVEKKISSTAVSLRVAFSHKTKIITLSYRTSPEAAWKKHATFSTTNKSNAKRRGNWRMKANGKFTIALYAGGEGAVVPAGQMSLDNFSIRNLK